MLVYVYNMDEVILDLLVGVALAFVLVPIYGYLLHFITQKILSLLMLIMVMRLVLF